MYKLLLLPTLTVKLLSSVHKKIYNYGLIKIIIMGFVTVKLV